MMPPHPPLAPARAWHTWSHRPAEMVFLPLGVRLTPLAYSAHAGAATLFPMTTGLTPGRHALDSAVVEATLLHAGTSIDWMVRKAGPFDLLCTWRATVLGEWGLRFWLNLCLAADGGAPARYDARTGAVWVEIGHRSVALVCDPAPVQVTGHDDVAALAADYEQRGYFDTASRAGEAPLLAMRCNLEMMREGRAAVAVADRADFAIARALAVLAEPPDAPHLAMQSGIAAGALDAVRDVIGWSTVWDAANARPYTCTSRNWTESKFGGFGVWLNDQLFAALLAGLLDPQLARENMATALASATPQGNLACLLTSRDAWVDRTQIPVGAFVVWLMHLRGSAHDLLAGSYDTLARNHAWWWRMRDPTGCGLASYGTSDVGSGLYRGTHFGARNESSMDNAPIHDEADYDPITRTLTTLDVGLNSMLALDAEMLGLVAAALGRGAEADAHAARAAATRALIGERLWDDARGIFANRLRGGGFVRSVGPTSFFPLLCGAVDAMRRERLLAHLDDPAMFAGPFAIPGTARGDPAARDNVYWRGRIWPPLNFLVWHGLRRAGEDTRAARLAADSLDLFRRAWDARRICAENYNAETGEPLDQADTDGFYVWGALLPAMGVASVMDVSPWHGWELTNTGQDGELGPLESPAGAVTVRIEAGTLTLRRGDAVLLATDLRGRIGNLVLSDRVASLRLPRAISVGAMLRFPALAGDHAMAAIGGRPAAWSATDGGIALTPDDAGATVLVAAA